MLPAAGLRTRSKKKSATSSDCFLAEKSAMLLHFCNPALLEALGEDASHMG